MIFTQPVILALEFVNHTLVIVVTGLLIAEYTICHYRGGASAGLKKGLSALLAIPILGGAMMLFDFFIARGDVWPGAALYIPGIATILYLGFLSKHVSPKGASISAWTVFMCATGCILLFSVAYIFTQQQFIVLSSTIVQTTGMIALYLYVLSFFIASDNERHELHIP